MNTTSTSQSSTTGLTAWIVANRLKSSAISILSNYGQTLYSIKYALSLVNSKTDVRQIESLSKLLSETQKAMDDAKIEQALSRPNPRQMEMVEAFWRGRIHGPTGRPEYDTIVMIAGNQSGKTYGAGRMCFAKWLRDFAQDGDVYWCIAPTLEKSIDKQQKELWESLPRRMFGEQMWDAKNGFGTTRPMVVLQNQHGSIHLRFKASAQYDNDPRSFESETLSGVWIDESIDERVYEAILPRLVAEGGFVLGSFIPDVSWAYDRFVEPKPGSKIACIRGCMGDNAMNLSEGAVERMRSQMSADEASMRIDGNFKFLSGLVYREFIKEYSPEGHLVKPFRVPRHWPRFRAIDWGNAHPTVCLWGAIDQDEVLYIYREYVQSRLSVQKHTENILRLSAGERYNRNTVIDPSCFNRNQSNAASIADEFKKFGLICRPGIRVAAVGEQATIQRVKRRLEGKAPDDGPMLRVFDNCEHLIWEFRRWKHKTDREGRPLGSDSYEDKNNDALDALKYMVCSNPCYAAPVSHILLPNED